MANYYLLKIALVDSDPLIWRKVYVPDNTTLEDLHNLIQNIMKWENDHPHGFFLGNKSVTKPVIPFFPHSHEADLILKNYLPLSNPKNPLYYVYDFGDNWVHEITLEDEHYQKTEGYADVACVDGAFAPPPDDIGGVYEYAGIYKLLKKKEQLPKPFDEWFEEDYDPDFFDINEINANLCGCYKLVSYPYTESSMSWEEKKKARDKKKAARQNKKSNRKKK